LSKIITSNYVARSIQLHIRQSYGRDDPVSPPFRRSQPNENDLILIVFYDFAQFGFKFNLFGRIQVALENRELQVITKIAARLKDFPQPLIIGDIVTN
jgi:hypothetical protein